MAKLKAPLLSLGASGKLGGALVFFNWKGIDVVREYVVPTNPNTTLQQTQRGYLTTLVAAIHTAQAKALYMLVEADQVAYANLANAKGRVMTWFNMACKLGLDALRLADGYNIYSWGKIVDTDKDDFRPRIYFTDNGVLQIAAATYYLGSTRTNLIHSIPAGITAGVRADIADGSGFSGLTAGEKYYWQLRPDVGDPCEGSDSGIYYDYAV